MPVARLHLLVAHPSLHDGGVGDVVVCQTPSLLPLRGAFHLCASLLSGFHPPPMRGSEEGVFPPTLPCPVLLVILLAVCLILIREQFLVEEEDVALLADEAHARSIFAALVHLHAQQLRHRVLVVDQVSPFHASLKDHLQALARGGDIDKQDTEFFHVTMNPEPRILNLTWIVHVVDVHHHQSRQACCRLLAPASYGASLGGRLVESRLEDECRQLALQRCIARLAEFVNCLVPLSGPDERKELRFVNGHGRLCKCFLITKHGIS